MSAERRTIALIGARCAGKSAVGRRLAELLGRPFLDLDQELAALFAAERESGPEAGEPPPAGAILLAEGEERFRALEQRALRAALSRSPSAVLSTGGGCVERAANRELLAARCLCVWLRAAPAVLARRMAADSAARPALSPAGAIEEIAQVAARRAPHYQALARFTVDTDDEGIEVLAGRVARLVRGPVA